MFEGDLLHKFTGVGVVETFTAVVVRGEDQSLPELVQSLYFGVKMFVFDGLSQKGGD